jgi:hypothetical protein
MKKIMPRITNFLKKFKPKQKDLTYEDFIALEGKKFQKSDYIFDQPQERYGRIRRYDL